MAMLTEGALPWLGVFAFPAAAGLMSGVSHCAAMCGPIHLFLARGGGRGLWAYHAGRVVTYGGLGLVAGLLAAGIRFEGAGWAWAALYAVLGLRLVGVPLWPSSWGVRYGSWMTLKLRPLMARAGEGNPALLFAFGLAAGFLPCATTGAGLAWAAGTADPLTGGTGMLVLGAATLPLFLVWPRKWFPRGKWYHAALGVGLLLLAAWKAYGLVTVTATEAACH